MSANETQLAAANLVEEEATELEVDASINVEEDATEQEVDDGLNSINLEEDEAEFEQETPTADPNAKKGKRRPKNKKKHRASVITRLLGHYNHGKTSKLGSWVVGILVFKKNPGFLKLKQVVEERVCTIGRFRSKFVSSFIERRAHFKEIHLEDMDMEHHLVQAFQGETPSMEQVQEFVGNMDYVLDNSKPLWQFTFIPKLDDGRSVLITNISHAIADGMSQVEVLLRILDPEETKGGLEKFRPAKRRGKKKFNVFTKARIFMGGVWEGLSSPISPSDPYNTLRMKNVKKPSPNKLLSTSEVIDLQKFKDIKNKYTGCSLNDVLLALLTMSLRAYYEEAQDPAFLKGKRIRAAFPINLRKPGKDVFKKGNPHNKWAYGFMRFDFKYPSNASLVYGLRDKIARIKISPSPLVQTQAVKLLLAVQPRSMVKSQSLAIANKTTAQISNVAGPQTEATLAGAGLDAMSFYLFAPLGMYYGIMSYNGKVSACLSMDSGIGVHPREITKHWKTQFDQFYEETMAFEGDVPEPAEKCCNCF